MEKDERCHDSKNCLSAYEDSCRKWASQIDCYVMEIGSLVTKAGGDQPHNKKLVQETRATLRFGLRLFSLVECDDVPVVQHRTVEDWNWHASLVALLSLQQGDRACRLHAARLLSNLVTRNEFTASKVLSILSLSPSPDRVSARIREDILGEETKTGQVLMSRNWVEIMVVATSTDNRDAFAAIVCALYNALISVSGEGNERIAAFPQSIASDTMLMNVLLRQFIPVTSSVKDNLRMVEAKKEMSQNDDIFDDSATHWIYLLFTKLCEVGYFQDMFDGTSGGNPMGAVVFPEHNVMLHCMVRRTEEFSSSMSNGQESVNPFGNVNSYMYLARLGCALMHFEETTSDIADVQLVDSAIESILEILAIALGTDLPEFMEVRRMLGSDTRILPEAALLLGSTVDDVVERSTGIKARDLKISRREQRLLVFIVQLLGNLSYHCRANQDLLRLTSVPFSSRSHTGTTGLTSTASERNALHVLMNTTSLATSCFTLREWGIVAIRNALEDNAENQAIVSDLEAQEAVPASVLENAGVGVKLDSNGRATLAPLEKQEQNR